MPNTELPLSEILAARAVIDGKLYRTPMLSAMTLGEMSGGILLWLKCEQFQKTGSFKPRGAMYKLSRLSAEEKGRGLVTASAGNHAQGLSYAARLEGVAVTIVMPADAPRAKIDAVKGYGGVPFLDGTVNTFNEKADALAKERGWTRVSAYDDPAIMAGQGTIGLEILEDVPDVEYIVCPIGGGGLISGIAAAVKQTKPDVKIIGVESTAGGAFSASLAAGERVRVECGPTIAGGIIVPQIGAQNYPLMLEYVDEVVQVSDEEIKVAVRLLLERCKMLVEGAGGAATAALLAHKLNMPANARVVSILSGGNVDLEKVREWL